MVNKIYLTITSIIILLLSIGLLQAGTTTMNRKMNLKIGDCWNNKQITEVNGFTITWIKGCTQQIKNESSDSPNENSQETQNTAGEGNKSGQMPVSVDNHSAEIHFCNKLDGNGNHNLIITSNNQFSDEYMIDWGKWIFNEIKTEKPFDEFEYTLYFEKKEGDCNFGKYTDVRFTITDLVYAKGMSWWNEISVSKIWFDDSLDNKKWHFLLFHELAHIFLKSGHLNDGSILEQLGGDGKFRDYQIEIIRRNLW